MDPVENGKDEQDDLEKRMAIRPPGAVLWTWQTCDVIIAVCAVSTAFIGLDFMLIPLTMAYMTTYAMGPVMDLLEARPYTCFGGKEMCAAKVQWTKMVPVWSVNEAGETRMDPSGNPIPLRDDNRNVVLEKIENRGDDAFFQLDESGQRMVDKFGKDMKIEGCGLDAKNCVMLLKLPHVVACLITLLSTIALLATLAVVVGSSFADFADGEDKKDKATCDTCCVPEGGGDPGPPGPAMVCDRQDTVKDKLTLMANEFINQLEDDGVKVIRPRICETRDASNMKVVSHVQDMSTVTSDLFSDDEAVVCAAVTIPAIEQSDTSRINALQASTDLAMRNYNANTFRCDISFEYMVTRGYGMQMQGATCSSPTLDYNTGYEYDVLQPDDAFKLQSCLSSLEDSGDLINGSSTSVSMRRSLGGLREAMELARSPQSCESVDNDEFLGGLDLLYTTDDATDPVNSCADFENAIGQIGTDITLDNLKENCALEVDIAGETYPLSYMCPQQCDDAIGFRLNETLRFDVCRTQASMMRSYYNKALDSFRVKRPPADMTMAIRLFNFTQTLSQELPNCTAKNLFATREDLAREKEKGIVRGSTWDEFMATVNSFSLFMNDLVLIVLLAVYILLERPEGSTLGGGDSRVLSEVEALITDYIILKAALSFMTGFLTAVMLLACKVQLALIFGLLAFLLNFIPSVGSMIAMVLPIPLVWLDDNISMTMKIVAIMGPAAVQGYIGNALEPSVFGKSMNMTAISVLLALVLFGFIWGLSGAVLSVPFLGIIKIVCHHTDHPLAKYFLITVREDPNYP